MSMTKKNQIRPGDTNGPRSNPLRSSAILEEDSSPPKPDARTTSARSDGRRHSFQQQRSSVCVLAEDQGLLDRMKLRWSKFYTKQRRILFFSVLDPRHNGKLSWDLLIMIVVLYSAIMVPLEVGFPELDLNLTTTRLSNFADILFVFDIIQNFFVGYYASDDEVLVVDRWKIAKRYLTKWFFFDVISLLPTPIILAVPTAHNQSVTSLKLARAMRLLKVAKLGRLLKLREFVMKFEDLLDLDVVVVRMTQLIFQVLLVAHVLACFWHWIGNAELEADAPTSWIQQANIVDSGSSTRYIYSFYWVIVTITGVGFGDIVATNTEERIYSIVAEIVGTGGFGLVIGSITKILENWNREETIRTRKLAEVQQFIKRKAIPKTLKRSIMRYFRHYIAKTSAFDERELLCEFSLSLRGEVLHQTYEHTFFRIPAFQRLNHEFVMDMAMYIKPLIAIAGDELAREGSIGTEMFILNKGLVEVKRTAENGGWIIVMEILTERSIFGESSLLNYTLHTSSYVAKDTCDLYTLPKEDFDKLIEEFPDAEQSLQNYHIERNALYERVYQQTLARYHVFLDSRVNDPVSDVVGIENVYPTLSVLLDGALCSYRTLPIYVLERMSLEISMGVSVFNSVTEKNKMIEILAQKPKGGAIQWARRNLLQPILPGNVWKGRWDFYVGLLLIYSVVEVPYEVTFLEDEVETMWGLQLMEKVVIASFAIDIVLTFRTALVDYRNDQLTITSSKKIAMSYLRFWFWIDLVSTLPLASIFHSYLTDARTLQFVRVIRLIKLSRLLKIARAMLRMQAVADTHHTIWRLLRLTMNVVFIAHLLACGYHYTSVLSHEVYKVSVLDDHLEYETNVGKYVICISWAVSTMTTVGYGDTPPRNTAEVLYVTCGVLIGASTFTYIISTLASIVDEVYMTWYDNRERMDRLKAYLRERNVSKPLAARLRRYYEYYLARKDDEQEATILMALSNNLRSQLVLHLNRDVVSKISFFSSQDDACVSYLMGILDPEFCPPDEYVFKEGQAGRHMYFLVRGTAEVIYNANMSKEVVVSRLKEGSYFGEIAMLTRSKRAASIRAKTYVNLLVLSRTGLDRMSLHYPEVANQLLEEFRKKIKMIKQKSTHVLLPTSQRSSTESHGQFSQIHPAGEKAKGSLSELHKELNDLEQTMARIMNIYGGGDRGKRKALGCVMQHLRKFEFSLDDFLTAAEDYGCMIDGMSLSSNSSVGMQSNKVMNKMQINLRRRSSFSTERPWCG